MTIKTYLFIALGAFGVFYLVMWISAIRKRASGESIAPTAFGTATGFVTNFFDTLGIGSFATTTSIFRFWKLVRDEVIPGTLNVGHTLPTIAQAFIYIAIVNVDMKTLLLLIAASVLGILRGILLFLEHPVIKVAQYQRKVFSGFAGFRTIGQISRERTFRRPGKQNALAHAVVT